MLADPWAIALLVSAVLAIFLLGGAGRTAFRVLLHWAPEKDTSQQIALENETWLAALLVRHGLLLQIFSLVLLLAAATSFAKVLAGAMCAAGAFAANPFGLPALAVKIVAVFLYGLWLVLHGLDLCSEHSPLVRIKFAFLLVLFPLVLLDSGLVVLYLVNLTPDIVTSCCGVLFGPKALGGMSLFSADISLLPPFLGLAAILLLAARTRQRWSHRYSSFTDGLLAFGSPLFLALALSVVTSDISPYIYALPSHRCPFDLFDQATHYIGFPLYFCLFSAVFAGTSAGAVAPLSSLPGLATPIAAYRRHCLRLVLALLPLFLLICLYYPMAYLLRGGE
jgi:hypothetical protein